MKIRNSQDMKSQFSLLNNNSKGKIEPYEWWRDAELLTELDHRSEQIKNGNDKGQLWEDAKKEILSHTPPKETVY